VPASRKDKIVLTATVKGLSGPPKDAQEEIGYGSWLSRDVLLVVARIPDECTALEGVLVGDDEARSLDVQYLACTGAPSSSLDEPGWIMSTVCVGSGAHADRNVTLHLRTVDAKRLDGEFELPLTSLERTLRRSVTALDAPERARVLQFIASAPREHRIAKRDLALNKSLFTIRQALRERFPAVAVNGDEAQAMHVDVLIAADEGAFYMQGWVHDAEAPIARLTAVSPEGERVELVEALFRYPRPDLHHLYGDFDRNGNKPGFIVFYELKTPSYLQHGWVIEMENQAGTQRETNVPLVLDEPLAARTQILGGLPLEALPNETLMSRHVHPAITRLGERQGKLLKVTDVVEYGSPGDSPEVSVIVPLYGRVDFLEHQLAQFVHDPAMRAVDLVYVLDSPQLERMLRDYSAQLFHLYRMPFRVVMLEHSCGFAAANNAGIRESRGSLLLLLNSDVMPARPGWLSKMVEFYKRTENIGALGVKLLYPDQSLQHAGMFFDLPTDTALAGLWRNVHYFKGFQRDLPAANVTRSVPAVTGACLMIAKDLYERVGGFSDAYVQGDHEDSDLCLQLIEEGHENWYLPEVELYHLEGQSYPSAARGAMALYNRWLHTRRRGELIEAAMTRYPSSIETTIV
jgi:O-antigen biosynthesis protein